MKYFVLKSASEIAKESYVGENDKKIPTKKYKMPARSKQFDNQLISHNRFSVLCEDNGEKGEKFKANGQISTLTPHGG